MLGLIADLLAAAMQGDEGYIADFYRVAGWRLTAIGGFGEKGRHFEAEDWEGQASRARHATVGRIVSLHYGILRIVLLC